MGQCMSMFALNYLSTSHTLLADRDKCSGHIIHVQRPNSYNGFTEISHYLKCHYILACLGNFVSIVLLFIYLFFISVSVSTFRFIGVLVVDVSVCPHLDQLPHWTPTKSMTVALIILSISIFSEFWINKLWLLFVFMGYTIWRKKSQRNGNIAT